MSTINAMGTRMRWACGVSGTMARQLIQKGTRQHKYQILTPYFFPRLRQSSRISSFPAFSTRSIAPAEAASSPGRVIRILRTAGLLLLVFAGSFTMATVPAMKTINGIISPPSDESTLQWFPLVEDHASTTINFHIDNNWLAREMRSKPPGQFSEVRPHLKVPPSYRWHCLTDKTLQGPGRLTVPPLSWIENSGKCLVSISHFGPELCGHTGIIHGGFLATMLDEGMARCCFNAIPHGVAVTANIKINYRAPCPANSYVVLRATTIKVEGRKAWVEGRLEILGEEGQKPTVVADAEGLFISPKQAGVSYTYTFDGTWKGEYTSKLRC